MECSESVWLCLVRYPYKKTLFSYLLILILIPGFFSLCKGQQRGSIWVLGDSLALDFGANGASSPTLDTLNPVLVSPEAVNSICDPRTGALLFYTDGLTVYNRAHQVMSNGNGLNGGRQLSSSQVLIFAWPGQDSLYFIIHTDNVEAYYFNGSGTGKQYSVVDLRQQGGMGAVVQKNIPLFQSTFEGMAVLPHSNGFDRWLIFKAWNSNEIRSYRVNCQGIDTSSYVTSTGHYTGGTGLSNYYTGVSSISSSPDGKFVVIPYSNFGKTVVYQFDGLTGQLSSHIEIDLAGFGAAFSPSQQRLYLSVVDPRYALYQYDLSSGQSASVNASRVLLHQYQSWIHPWSLRLGGDQKVYVAQMLSHTIGVVSHPDSLGLACNFNVNGLSLGSSLSFGGLPEPFFALKEPDDYVPNFSTQGACVGDTVVFNDVSDFIPDSVYWDFGVHGSGGRVFSKGPQVRFVYDSAGSYDVFQVVFRGCRADTVHKRVDIFPIPNVDLGDDRTICDSSQILLTAFPQDSSFGHGLQFWWSSGSTDSSLLVNQAGAYQITVTSAHGCSSSDTVQLGFGQSPMVDLGVDTTFFCSEVNLLLDGDIGGSGVPGTTFFWSTADTNPSIQVRSPGLYWVRATNGACSRVDSITIAQELVSELDLGPDRGVCPGEIVELDAGLLDSPHVNGIPWDTYLWSGQQSSQVIAVTSGSGPGVLTIWAEVRAGICLARDTVLVSIFPDDPLDLGSDTLLLCQGKFLDLDAGPGGGTYLWSTGHVGRVLQVDSPGVYTVMGLSPCASGEGSRTVIAGALPAVALPDTLWLCGFGASAVLDVGAVGPVSGGFDCNSDGILETGCFRWSTGEQSGAIAVDQPGLVWVEVENSCGLVRDSVLVLVRHAEDVLVVPNVFSPNGDGVNDDFGVYWRDSNLSGAFSNAGDVVGMVGYSLIVSDRWGRVCFETNSISEIWDGRIGGRLATEGVYFWAIRYLGCEGRNVNKSGSVLLKR